MGYIIPEKLTCICARENVEDTLGYKNIAQLSIDGLNVSWKFSNKFAKTTNLNERNET